MASLIIPQNSLYVDYLRSLSKLSGLPCSENVLPDQCYLTMINDSLTYIHQDNKAVISKVSFDFIKMWKYHEQQKYKIKNEIFAKSLGLSDNRCRFVIDATCGSGKDSILMLHYGCRVLALERNNLVYSLLFDAHRRLVEYFKYIDNSNFKFDIILADSKYCEDRYLEKTDVIYCDPMYPRERRSALPRKEIQFFQSKIGFDADRLDLFNWALSQKKRTVIKRPKKGVPPFGRPVHTFSGKTTCYDIYS